MLDVATIPELEVINAIYDSADYIFILAYTVTEINTKYNRYYLN